MVFISTGVHLACLSVFMLSGVCMFEQLDVCKFVLHMLCAIACSQCANFGDMHESVNYYFKYYYIFYIIIIIIINEWRAMNAGSIVYISYILAVSHSKYAACRLYVGCMLNAHAYDMHVERLLHAMHAFVPAVCKLSYGLYSTYKDENWASITFNRNAGK